MAHDVVISYAPAHASTAQAACAALEAQGVKCWIASRDVPRGCDEAEVMLEAIGSGRVMLRIVPPSADDPTRPAREMERAVREGVTVVPFRPGDALPTDQQQQQFHRLAETLQQLLAQSVVGPDPAAGPIPLAGEAPRPAATPVAAPPPALAAAPKPAAAPPPVPVPVLRLDAGMMIGATDPSKKSKRRQGRDEKDGSKGPWWASPWLGWGGAAAAAAFGCGAVGFLFGRVGRPAPAAPDPAASVAAVPVNVSGLPKLAPRRPAPSYPSRPASPATRPPAGSPAKPPSAPSGNGPTAVARADGDRTPAKAPADRRDPPASAAATVASADPSGRMPVVPVQQLDQRLKAMYQAAEGSRLNVRSVKTKKVIWRPAFGMQPVEITAAAEFPDHFAFLQKLHADFPDAGLSDLDVEVVPPSSSEKGGTGSGGKSAPAGRPKLRGVYNVVWSVSSDRTEAAASSTTAEPPPRRQRDWGGVFSAIGQAMGRDVTLSAMRLQTVEGANGRPAASTPFETERAWHRQRFALLRLRGDAASDPAIAALLNKLTRTPDFRNVVLVSADDAARKPGGKARRSFEIEFTVSCDEPNFAVARSQVATVAARR